MMKLQFDKDNLKFSSAHFTLFPDGTKEALHGHNYYVQVTFEVADNAPMLPFKELKQAISKIVSEWDEKVLLPASVTIQKMGDSLDVMACGKNYRFPADEVCVLDTNNITSENLAKLLCWKLRGLSYSFLSIEVSIEESRGQRVIYKEKR